MISKLEEEQERMKVVRPPGFAPGAETDVALMAVKAERMRQNDKWGIQRHEPSRWLAILGEEFGEVSTEVLKEIFGAETSRDVTEDLRTELTHVAAVAVAWIEDIDRYAG